MFIAIKDTKIISISEVEWQCRRRAKGLDKSAYWTWLKTVTSGDPPVSDFSGEDYKIVETDAPLSYVTKDGEARDITVSFNQSGHIHSEIDIGKHYHLKWNASKKVIVKDDAALSACQIAEKWKSIRNDRNRRLAETDYLAMADQPSMANNMQIYRKKLRDLPQDNSDPNDITWPSKPK